MRPHIITQDAPLYKPVLWKAKDNYTCSFCVCLSKAFLEWLGGQGRLPFPRQKSVVREEKCKADNKTVMGAACQHWNVSGKDIIVGFLL